MEKAPHFNNHEPESANDPVANEIANIEAKVEKFQEVYDQYDHDGTDQDLKARIAGYSDFSAYEEDVEMLFDIQQGKTTAVEALNARKEKIQAAMRAKEQLQSRARSKSKKRSGNNRRGDSFKSADIPFGEQ